MIAGVLTFLGSIASLWAQAKIKEQEAKVTLAARRAEAAAQWDVSQVDASMTSWKDEWWTIILSIPLILCFFPDYAPYIREGFVTLRESVPEWYILAVGVAISAAFGYRKFADFLMKRRS